MNWPNSDRSVGVEVEAGEVARQRRDGHDELAGPDQAWPVRGDDEDPYLRGGPVDPQHPRCQQQVAAEVGGGQLVEQAVVVRGGGEERATEDVPPDALAERVDRVQPGQAREVAAAPAVVED